MAELERLTGDPRPGSEQTEGQESESIRGYDFIPVGAATKEVRYRHLVADGKTVIEQESPEARTALIIDKDSVIETGEDGVMRSSRIAAEIHSTDTDVIIGEAGMLLVVVGDGLVNQKDALSSDGSVRPGEFTGEGVTNGRIVVVRPGDKMLVHAGMAHVHGTLPGSVAAATFVKRREAPQS